MNGKNILTILLCIMLIGTLLPAGVFASGNEEVADANLDTQIWHVSDTGCAEALEVNTAGQTAAAETTGFSLYTVEFTYGVKQYVMQGGKSMPLSTVLNEVGLYGNVDSVAVSRSDLFDAVNENGIWTVYSYQAFDTTEWMKVVIGGQEYEIVVTDDDQQHKHDDIVFEEWTDEKAEDQYGENSGKTATNSLPKSGSYYLKNNVTLDNTWERERLDDVNLCLNGHTITFNTNDKDAISNEYIIGYSLYSMTICSCEESGTIVINGKGILNQCILYLRNIIVKMSNSSLENPAIENHSFLSISGTTVEGDILGTASINLSGSVYIKRIHLKKDTEESALPKLNIGNSLTTPDKKPIIVHPFIETNNGRKIVADEVFTSGLSGKGDKSNFASPEDLYTVDIKENGEAYLRAPVEITTDVNEKDYGEVTGEGKYIYDDTVVCEAMPYDGYVFDQWVDENKTNLSYEVKYEFPATVALKLIAYFYRIVFSNSSIGPQEYTGEPIMPDVGSVQLDGVDGVYKENEDYTISYKDNMNVGEAEVTVTFYKDDEGKGFSGSKSIKFDIVPASISNANVEVADQVYNGDELRPVPKVTWNGKELVEGTDFKLSYANNRDVGTDSKNPPTVTVTGMGNFKDSVSKTFRISPKPVTIKVNDAVKPVGEKDPEFTGTVEGLVNSGDLGEIKYIRTKKDEDEAAGTYKGVLTAEYVPNNNYKVTVENGDFTIKQVFTLKWLDGDGSVLQSKTYVDGDQPPVYDGKTPAKASTAQYSYSFTGWDTGTVAGPVTTYQSLFKGEVNKYKVTFVDEDGKTVLKAVKEYDYGTAAEDIEKPADPTKDPDAQYTYTFAGWDPAVAEVTGDVTYKATYSNTVNKYKVTFVDEDGKTILKAVKEYGYGTAAEDIEKPADPTKDPDAQYTYTFAGWDPAVAEVTGDATYKATYKATPVPVKIGTLTFDLSGGTLDGKTGNITIEANVGDTIKLPGAPAREGYTFQYWKGSRYEAGADYKVEGDHTFTAVWEENKAKTYEVTFDANGHGTAPASQTVEEGKEASKPKDPTASGYTFGGWFTDKECKSAYSFDTAVTNDITLYAKWTLDSRSSGGDNVSSPSSSGKTSVNTGDNNPAGIWLLLLTGSLGSLILVFALKRKIIK